jgi:hypothetical protein
MPIEIRGGQIKPLHPTSNYLVSDTLCNSFVAGEIGSPDDFFLVGTAPHGGTDYPLLTGNVLDSEGHLLFRLVQNILVINPQNCSKISGNLIGYEIHDALGKPIFKVQTTFENVPRVSEEMYVTRVTGNFYNKKGEIAFMAEQGGSGGKVAGTAKFALGFHNGRFGPSQFMSREELEVAAHIISSKGSIYEPLRGKIEDKTINLDGKILVNVELNRCHITMETGIFDAIGKNVLSQCELVASGYAGKLIDLYRSINAEKKS